MLESQRRAIDKAVAEAKATEIEVQAQQDETNINEDSSTLINASVSSQDEGKKKNTNRKPSLSRPRCSSCGKKNDMPLQGPDMWDQINQNSMLKEI